MASDKIQQLQLLEQNRQNLLLQKNQLEAQKTELDSALSEIESTPQAYKILGKVMVAADKDSLKKELESQKEITDVRIKNLVTQQEKVQENIQSLQKDVVEGLQNENGQ